MTKELNWLYDYPNLKLYQYKEGFKFSLDSILLAEFAEIRKKDIRIVDFCTGNGVIPTILAWKTQKQIIGIEFQEEIYNLAIDSLKENHLGDKIHYICDNVKNITNYYSSDFFDVILCNPPYFRYSKESHVNQCDLKKIARHEVFIDLATIISLASKMLHTKGRFYLVHLPERLDEIIVLAYQNRLAVKKIQFIYSNEEKNAKIVLVCLVKDGRFGVKVLPAINISSLSTYQNLFKKGE